MFLRISSTPFSDGERIPENHAHDHANPSPRLAWRAAPRETQGLVLVVEDEDAPLHGTFYHWANHWAVYDIPAGCSQLHEGAARRGTEFRNRANNYGNPSNEAPLPPTGGGIHRCRFRLTARDHVLKQAEPVGTCER